MVKPDVHRDYYADLGLMPSAIRYGNGLHSVAPLELMRFQPESTIPIEIQVESSSSRPNSRLSKLLTKFLVTPNSAKGRPQSSYNGHSTGTQSHANYARAGPRPPWEKTYDAGQTGASAYRRSQGTWGTSTTRFRFGQRTGKAAGVPRPNAAPTGKSTRPKSAYDYFKTTTDQSSRTQSTRKKHGFAPRSASGDEPMAANTSSYTTVPRRERFQASDSLQREAAPTATTEKPAAQSGYGAENTGTPNSKQNGSKNASTDGDKAFFPASGLHNYRPRRGSKFAGSNGLLYIQ
ncbi:hypothetical protein AbraIFM66951_005998 [Aspergillus brasiliensis]|nr:hypothetical protein AbraIFM66951_005998 [Aspergillus brasiliensis]